MAQRTYGSQELTPNQEYRRNEIIEVACALLREKGIDGCTVRAVADQAGVSNGTIHYYFSDVIELRDLGYARLTEQYFSRIRERVADLADPLSVFWHSVAGYLSPWDEHASMPLLWCEYYLTSLRAGRPEGPTAAFRSTIDFFTTALVDVCDDAAPRAEALFRHTNGTVTSQALIPVTLTQFIAEAAILCGIPAPDPSSSCAVRDCLLCRPRAAARRAAATRRTPRSA